jgi:hypothetical protein
LQVLLAAVVTAACAGLEPSIASAEGNSTDWWATWNRWRGDPYELDSIERWLAQGEKPSCDARSLVSYSGTTIRYAGSVLVREPFRERLRRFEQVVADAAEEIYGRPPRRLLHYGTYSCRSTRNRSRLLSEHALGNAIDVAGFDFGPLPKRRSLPPGLEPSLRGSFRVSVARHWSARPGAVEQTHQRFLRVLGARLRARTDIFRSMYGPDHGGHDDHLHLDVSPFRYVDL